MNIWLIWFQNLKDMKFIILKVQDQKVKFCTKVIKRIFTKSFNVTICLTTTKRIK